MVSMRKQRWTQQDRESFATQRLRAQTIPAKRDTGPQADEWDGCDCRVHGYEMCPEDCSCSCHDGDMFVSI
jgi:hypothetical protein